MSSIRQILEKKMGEQWDSTTDIYGLREVPWVSQVGSTVQHPLWIYYTYERFEANKIHLNETCSKVRTGKYLSDAFPTQIGLKKGNIISALLFNFPLRYATDKARENQ